MRSTELHGERRGWNLHFKRRVVRCGLIFLEVWIFRNVRNKFQDFIAHHVSATPAKREDGIPHQDHAGARFILMAYLVNPGLLDQLSRSQRAIALIIGFKSCFGLSVLQFHSGVVSVPSIQPPRARRAGSNSAIRKWDAFRAAESWSAQDEREIFADLFSGNPRWILAEARLIKDSSPAR